MSMLIIHSRKTIETAPASEVGSFDGFVRAVCGMDPVGFAFGSTHPTARP